MPIQLLSSYPSLLDDGKHCKAHRQYQDYQVDIGMISYEDN